MATKAKCESLTDKIQLNISITETGGLNLYINIKKDLHALYTTVNLAVDLSENDEYDFDVVKRTVDCCKLFKDPTYEPVVQFLYKIFLDSGHFPTNCPVKKVWLYIPHLTHTTIYKKQIAGFVLFRWFKSWSGKTTTIDDRKEGFLNYKTFG